MPDNTCICCGRVIPEGRHICLTCERGNEMQTFRPCIRTNGDRIRAMSNAELVTLLMGSYPCDSRHGCPDDCKSCISDWLESEVQT